MKSGSRLERILNSGGFAVTGELGPPKSGDPEVVREKARLLKGNVDAVNITDCQTAIVRMSSIGAGLITLSEGVEPVIQMTCRDRNRIGMQSDILGAAALGLKNLLCLTGDHQKFGNHPGAKGVFDMDSIQLLGMVKEMRDEKRFQSGDEIKSHEPRLFLGAAANPFAEPADYRAARLGKKVANGADFIQTQIVYNIDKFRQFMKMVCDLGIDENVHILAGVTPPRSIGMARYMKNFVPGMDVPDEVIDRLKGAADKEDEGINICVDIINQVKEIKGISGVHIMAIEWESAVPEIVKRAGLADRPRFDDDIAAVSPPRDTQVVISEAKTAESVEDKDQIIAAARTEAEKLIAEAREEVARMRTEAASTATPTTTVHESIESDDAGEHEMNERERQMALETVRTGLNALKKSFGLSDDQFEALVKFATTEAILMKEPPTGAATTSAPSTPAKPAAAPESTPAASVQPAAAKSAPAAPAQPAPAVDAAKEEEARAAAEAARKAELEKKAVEEAARKAELEKQAAVETAPPKEVKKEAEPSEAKKSAAKPGAKKSGGAAAGATALAHEETPLAERSAKIAEDNYKVKYTGKIRETVLGSGDNTVKVGGTDTMPFQLYEGEMPNKPLIAMDILDFEPDEWPETLTRHFAGVMDNPLNWARKCIDDYQAEAICLSLMSTDPNGMNRSAADAAKIAAEVVNNIEVPLILWGCGNSDKDTETLREITSLVGDKKVCLAPLSDANYRSIGATAMAFHHPMVAASPIDVNLAKQLNILLENLGVSLDSVLIDPSIGALGYGIEYTYSVMERIRLAAMTQQDEKLQVPFICNLGREVWKAKETKLPTDELLGDQERRGVLMEAMTASCMLMAGGEVLIMRHPQAIALTKSLIDGLVD